MVGAFLRVLRDLRGYKFFLSADARTEIDKGK